ncbi:hypothetical protein SAMD00019534_011690, partial [Acytostelium subglobosum LB1]|uniref:hypothetical protein n=1 Tax=Acytostelium subglobosum LB1 TaxID=1410327 RepID=UPI000644F117
MLKNRMSQDNLEKSPLVGPPPVKEVMINGYHDESIAQSRPFTPVSAFWNTVKAFAGAGSFALPWAVSQAGIWIGSIGLVAIALLSNYTMSLLLKCNIKMSDEQLGTDQPPPSYADLGRRAFGRVGELFVCFMNFSVTMSICIAYLILIGQNFGELVNYNQQIIIWFILPVIMLLTFLTDMKYLGYTSIFGALSLLLAMGTVLTYGGIDYDILPYKEYHVDYTKVPLWFGVAAFFFCNHIVVIPISHASGDYHRYPRILDYSMVFITIVNVIFATLAYLYFYSYVDPVSHVKGVPSSITQALPNGVFANIVRMCVVFELTCSFPIVCGAGLNVVDSSIEFFHRHFSAFPNGALNNEGEKMFFSRNWMFYAVRIGLTAVLAAVATTITNFGSFTSLIGSLMLAIAGFVLPPLVYIKFFPEQSRLSFIIHIIISVFGVGATILGTYQSILSLINPPPS